MELKPSKEFAEFIAQVNDRIKADYGVEPKWFTETLSYATEDEAEKIKDWVVKVLVDNGETEEYAKTFYDNASTEAMRIKSERMIKAFELSGTYQTFVVNPCRSDILYGVPAKSKHQCTRKKKKKVNVKHGQRKKK